VLPIDAGPGSADHRRMNYLQASPRSVLGRITRVTATIGVISVAAVTMTGCLGEEHFAVGDCVVIEERVLDHDLEAADCADAVGTFDPNERIYKVDAVLEGADASCSLPLGFFGVEFSHEPHDVTYCLSMAT
jgi:hypothetical protein